MSIDYNADVLPLYASKLEGDPSYNQEFANVVGGTYDPDEARGVDGEQLKVNTVDTAVMASVSGTPVLQDWLDSVQALPLHGTDFEAAILNDTLVIVSLTSADLVIAAGTAPGGLTATGLTAGTFTGGGDLGTGRADQPNEQRLLTTLGVLVAHLRLLGSRAEARNLHFILSRIATGVGSGGFVYDDQSSSVSGNVMNPSFVVTDQITVEVVDPSIGTVVGTDFTTNPAGPGFDMDDLVATINVDAIVAGVTTKDLTAINDGGKLKLVSARGHNIEIQQGTVGNDLAASKAGIEFGISRSKRAEVAEKVKSDALDYFDTNRRDLNL